MGEVLLVCSLPFVAAAAGEARWASLECTCRVLDAVGVLSVLGPISPVVHKCLSLFGRL